MNSTEKHKQKKKGKKRNKEKVLNNKLKKEGIRNIERKYIKIKRQTERKKTDNDRK